jgi:hypothetical protein
MSNSNLTILSGSLRRMVLADMCGLEKLTIVTPALEYLTVLCCFYQSPDQLVADISARQLKVLRCTTGKRQIVVRQNVCRAHGKRCFCRAFSGRRTSNKNARYPYTLTCVFEGVHDNHKSLSCVFLGTHGNSSTLTFGRWELTGVKLCRAPWKNARQRQQVWCAFSYGARQSYSIAVRFTLAHDNVFLKIEFSHLILIFPS